MLPRDGLTSVISARVGGAGPSQTGRLRAEPAGRRRPAQLHRPEPSRRVAGGSGPHSVASRQTADFSTRRADPTRRRFLELATATAALSVERRQAPAHSEQHCQRECRNRPVGSVAPSPQDGRRASKDDQKQHPPEPSADQRRPRLSTPGASPYVIGVVRTTVLHCALLGGGTTSVGVMEGRCWRRVGRWGGRGVTRGGSSGSSGRPLSHLPHAIPVRRPRIGTCQPGRLVGPSSSVIALLWSGTQRAVPHLG